MTSSRSRPAQPPTSASHAAESSVQRQITQAQYTIASEFIHRGEFACHAGQILRPQTETLKAPSQISEADWSLYDTQADRVDGSVPGNQLDDAEVQHHLRPCRRETRVIPDPVVSPARSPHVLLLMAALFALIVGCDLQRPSPSCPPSTDTAAIADRVTGPDGQAFLRDITTASWDDDGHRAAELFAWVPRDAQSTDRAAATRAGQTAHAIASFLADEREKIAGAPANPALWQAFAQSLVPYLGAMVGDESGVVGFEPLDGPEFADAAHHIAVRSNDEERERQPDLHRGRLCASAVVRGRIRESRSGRAAVGGQRCCPARLFSRPRGCAALSPPPPYWSIRSRNSSPSRTCADRTRLSGRLADCSPGRLPTSKKGSSETVDFCLRVKSQTRTGVSTTSN